MDVFAFVLAIIVITTAAGLYRERLKTQLKQSKYQNNEAIDQRFADMEKRIETLERIVTDQKSQLRDTIDAL